MTHAILSSNKGIGLSALILALGGLLSLPC